MPTATVASRNSTTFTAFRASTVRLVSASSLHEPSEIALSHANVPHEGAEDALPEGNPARPTSEPSNKERFTLARVLLLTSMRWLKPLLFSDTPPFRTPHAPAAHVHSRTAPTGTPSCACGTRPYRNSTDRNAPPRLRHTTIQEHLHAENAPAPAAHACPKTPRHQKPPCACGMAFSATPSIRNASYENVIGSGYSFLNRL